MKMHIDTAPVWEAYRTDCECPLCLLNDGVEQGGVEYFLGESVMEPDQRIEVNEKGFCARHFRQMYDAGNRLGLALMSQTYMKQTLDKLRKNAEKQRECAAAEAGKTVFRRFGGRKGDAMQGPMDELKALMDTCVFCERVRRTMERYVYTILYMYKNEAEFPALLKKSRGLCLKHYAELLETAPKHLHGDVLKHFVDDLTNVEAQNLERLSGEVDWFIKKFDYRNQNEPWGTSRDAVRRAVNKLRWQVVDEHED